MNKHARVKKQISQKGYCIVPEKEVYTKFIYTFPGSDIGKSSFMKRIQKEVIKSTPPCRLIHGCVKCINFSLVSKPLGNTSPHFLNGFSCNNCHATFSAKPVAKNFGNLLGCIPHKRGKLNMSMLKMWVNSLS